MNVLHFELLESTNNYLKEHWSEFPDETVCIADRQTGGKGRLGRHWETPAGNLSFSVLFKDCVENVSLFPLCCALATGEVLEEITQEPIGIKWPNDLIIKNKKVCGILCEGITSPQGLQVVCGIGVNITLDQDYFDAVSLPYATSVKLATGLTPDPMELGQKIAQRLADIVREWRSSGFSVLKQRYENRLLNRNREVRVIYSGETRQALALGINEKGYLICQDQNEIFEVNSGEASVRGLYGYI